MRRLPRGRFASARLDPRDASRGLCQRGRRGGRRWDDLAQEPRLAPERTPREIVEEGLRDWHAASSAHASVTQRIAAGEGAKELLAEQAQLAHAIERLGGWQQGHRAADMLLRLGVSEI